MGYGIWDMGYGLWAMGYGLWAMGYGLWAMGYGLWDCMEWSLPLHGRFQIGSIPIWSTKPKGNIMSELNRKLLEGLIGAPDSQLSERLRKKCEDFNGTDKELIELFEEIYNSCHESSSIVKATVNPEFTRGYFEDDI
ncbi:hypothetical protein LCGC14_1874160 [marine sediment metagenome]|uniref:Uncharacterized protein n=1 Tax=marine sediment metagenome TaxID=412755 RepID=A0A0F9II56_9ZZZZ